MKITDTPTTQTSSQQGAFTIAATGKAFRILSDGLYSDKITAVLRELGCNAYDSHVAAGKADTPFEVHLPTDAEPYFSVTDHGTGISDQDINEIYTRYFASTKTDSNEFIGQLGLGSKSPFSLVREFRVESRHGGESRTYRMYFDESDTPRVEFLFSGATTETGLKVSFDVQSYSDRRRFAEKAAEVYSWFQVPPIITGNNTVQIVGRATGINADGWKIMPRTRHTNSSPIALMGNVAYPIDGSGLGDLTTEVSGVLGLSVLIRFGIGDLEVSASRESLGYDKRTVQNVVNRLADVAKTIREDYTARIAACDTEWKARQTHEGIFGYEATDRYAMQSIFDGHKILWNGIEIDGAYKKVDLSKVYDPNAKHGYRVHTGDDGKEHLGRVSWNEHASWSQRCDRKSKVVFNDCEHGGLSRIKNWAKSLTEDARITVYDEPDMVSWDDLRGLLGNPEVSLSSQMPQPPKKASKSTNMMIYRGSSVGRSIWQNETVDLSNGGYYVDTDSRKNPITPHGATVSLSEIIREAVGLGIIPADTKVYAPKGPMRRKIHKTEGWVELTEHIKSKVVRVIGSFSAQKAVDVSHWENVSWKLRRTVLSFDSTGMIRDTDGAWSKLTELSANMRAVATTMDLDKLRRANNLAGRLGYQAKNGTPDPVIDETISLFEKRYPLLSMIGDSEWSRSLSKICDYVNMVDQNYVWYAMSEPLPGDVQ